LKSIPIRSHSCSAFNNNDKLFLRHSVCFKQKRKTQNKEITTKETKRAHRYWVLYNTKQRWFWFWFIWEIEKKEKNVLLLLLLQRWKKIEWKIIQWMWVWTVGIVCLCYFLVMTVAKGSGVATTGNGWFVWGRNSDNEHFRWTTTQNVLVRIKLRQNDF